MFGKPSSRQDSVTSDEDEEDSDYSVEGDENFEPPIFVSKNTSFRANPLARSPGQVKLDSEK